ncbi:UNVERIFIED_CONTAM: hypothetical protein GTU68_025162 [Idotea baltica]|nr:hypothetical protein [Idotea baltica]
MKVIATSSPTTWGTRPRNSTLGTTRPRVATG